MWNVMPENQIKKNWYKMDRSDVFGKKCAEKMKKWGREEL